MVSFARLLRSETLCEFIFELSDYVMLFSILLQHSFRTKKLPQISCFPPAQIQRVPQYIIRIIHIITALVWLFRCKFSQFYPYRPELSSLAWSTHQNWWHNHNIKKKKHNYMYALWDALWIVLQLTLMQGTPAACNSQSPVPRVFIIPKEVLFP